MLKFLEEETRKARKMPPQFRALTTLEEDLVLLFSMHPLVQGHL